MSKSTKSVTPENYQILGPQEHQILEQAADIIVKKYLRGDVFSNPDAVKKFISCKLAHHEREVFSVLLLDQQHQLIEFNELFYGTINASAVYPREVVKLVINTNAAAVIFAHNHPSGIPEPSNADKDITRRLAEALNLIDVQTLDHIVVGKTCFSFAEAGLI